MYLYMYIVYYFLNVDNVMRQLFIRLYMIHMYMYINYYLLEIHYKSYIVHVVQTWSQLQYNVIYYYYYYYYLKNQYITITKLLMPPKLV